MKKIFDKENNNCVIISVDFNESTTNWFTGNEQEKGYWGYFSIGKRTEFGSVRVIPTNNTNFRILLFPTKRRNKKKEMELFNLIATNQISDLVYNGEKNKVYKLIK